MLKFVEKKTWMIKFMKLWKLGGKIHENETRMVKFAK